MSEGAKPGSWPDLLDAQVAGFPSVVLALVCTAFEGRSAYGHLFGGYGSRAR